MTPDRTLFPATPDESETADRSLLSAAAHPLPAATRRLLLAGEFLFLFIGIPLALFFGHANRLPPMPILWTVALYCLIVLLRDPAFDRRQLWNAAPLRSQFPQIVALFAAGVLIVTLLIRLYAPPLFLALPRTQPRLWALIMVGYPVLSVYPQGLIYRAFFFHRYRPLLETGFSGIPLGPHTRSAILILASGVTFALMHIVFHSWIALALTFPGGILFALRYCNTRSMAVSSLEHALYGCFLFTIGLGQFFYVRVV
jgi:membrane protease YdiL (CAAX protease family)